MTSGSLLTCLPTCLVKEDDQQGLCRHCLWNLYSRAWLNPRMHDLFVWFFWGSILRPSRANYGFLESWLACCLQCLLVSLLSWCIFPGGIQWNPTQRESTLWVTAAAFSCTCKYWCFALTILQTLRAGGVSGNSNFNFQPILVPSRSRLDCPTPNWFVCVAFGL